MLNLAGAASGSSAQYLILLKLRPTTFWKRLGLGADLDTTFGLAQSSNSISHFQFEPFAFYRVVETRKFQLDPRVYFVISSDQQSSSGVGFHTTQVGVGLYAAYQVGSSWQVHLEAMTESIGSQVITAHNDVDLGFNQVGSEKIINWGGGVQLQSYTVQDASSGLSYQFGQTSVYVLMLF